MKHKIYCINNGGSKDCGGWWNALAIADDGHILAQHICSHESFMPHDLGITSTWKHENYNAHFGENNWELEWVSDPEKHEGFLKAVKLYKSLPKKVAEKDHEKTKAGVTMEFSK